MMSWKGFLLARRSLPMVHSDEFYSISNVALLNCGRKYHWVYKLQSAILNLIVMNEWMNQSINERIYEWINDSKNQWINQWMNQWMNQWINEWINQSINQLVKQSVNQSIFVYSLLKSHTGYTCSIGIQMCSLQMRTCAGSPLGASPPPMIATE